MGVDVAQHKDEDELNEILRAPYRSASLTDIRDGLRETHEALTALVESLGPDDLFKTYSHYQPDEPGNDTRRARLALGGREQQRALPRASSVDPTAGGGAG